MEERRFQAYKDIWGIYERGTKIGPNNKFKIGTDLKFIKKSLAGVFN